MFALLMPATQAHASALQKICTQTSKFPTSAREGERYLPTPWQYLNLPPSSCRLRHVLHNKATHFYCPKPRTMEKKTQEEWGGNKYQGHKAKEMKTHTWQNSGCTQKCSH